MITQESKTDTEILSADEQKIREMCCSLKKVDAPQDFDFKLKARIARTNPRDFQPRFGFAFRYAMPALALIFVLGLLFAYNGGFWSSKDNQIVAESSIGITNPALPKNTMTSNFSAPDDKNQTNSAILPANQESPEVTEKPQVADNNPRTPKKDSRENKKDSFNGSKDFGFTPDTPKQPNFNSNSLLPNPQDNEKASPMSVKDVLSINGIKADLENGKWTVRSVTANSLGESSGVRENDIIEAIDNQPLSAETVFNKTVNGEILVITRNGVKSQIKLRGKQ
ncbi:MAG TPA: hypothetical protein VNB22_14145 [Pyrinomonadaceae bacterium]|jgi:hypothetical protein|nr:hypothetical protein [Pyrinomonadaceae bacterium]